MRSMYVSMLALALTVLLCACVSNVPVWETVDDSAGLPGRKPPAVNDCLCCAGWRGSADVLCLRCGAELLGAGRLV